jgi:hypothetical protein
LMLASAALLGQYGAAAEARDPQPLHAKQHSHRQRRPG